MSTSTEDKAIPVPDVIFKGTDGNECEASVVAIRDFAFATGRDGDHSWMLRFATTRLRGKALRWHASLDPSIINDWGLFVQALFNQYPSDEEDSEAGIATPVWSATTFSPGLSTVALPPNPEADRNLTGHVSVPLARQYDPSSTAQQIGLLRIVNAAAATTPQYLWWGYNESYNSSPHWTMTTINRHEALVVSFLPSSAPHNIGCLNSKARFTTLTLGWGPSPTREYYHVEACAYHFKTVTQAAKASGSVANAWNFLEDGTLQASVSSFSDSGYGEPKETKFTTTEVHIDISGIIIRFVRPGAPLEQDKPGSNPIQPFVRARIVFEPL